MLLFWAALAHSQSVYVYFDFNKSEITPRSRAILDSLTDSLDLLDRVELHGHCDSIGSSSYNEQLAKKRVNAVTQYLLNNGWEKQDILLAKGHGENQPFTNNQTPENRGLNRRVEIRIQRGIKTAPAPARVANNTKTTGAKNTEKQTNIPNLKQELNDTARKAGSNIVLRNLNFEGGRHIFLPESQPILEELLDAMIANPRLVIQVEGHICCEVTNGDGFDIDYSLRNLSYTRAKAVRDYLIQNGISPDRVTYKGLGHSMPIYPYPEKTEEERIANRRVEIKIIRK